MKPRVCERLSGAVFSEELQHATGLPSISFSQLGRRINAIPTVFFQSIFLDLVAQIHEKTQCLYVFDRGYLDYERFDRMTDVFSVFANFPEK